MFVLILYPLVPSTKDLSLIWKPRQTPTAVRCAAQTLNSPGFSRNECELRVVNVNVNVNCECECEYECALNHSSCCCYSNVIVLNLELHFRFCSASTGSDHLPFSSSSLSLLCSPSSASSSRSAQMTHFSRQFDTQVRCAADSQLACGITTCLHREK